MRLALYKEKTEYYNVKPSGACVTRLISSAALNKETVLSIQELNSLLVSLSKQNFHISSTNNDNTLQVIFPTIYHGFNVNVKSDVQVYLINENFKLSLSNTKIGKLPIPAGIAAGFLKTHGDDDIKIIKDEIFIPASTELDIYGHKVKVKINKLQIKNDSVTIKITGGLENLMSIIKEVTAFHCCNLLKF